jgi:hypothetical protein
MIHRQVRWNYATDPIEQARTRYRWTFLIVNEPTEIGRIRGRIYEQLQPIVDLSEIDSGQISGTDGLGYEAFSFSTDKSRINRSGKIYRSSHFKRDRDLRQRSDVEFQKFLLPILEGRKK